MDTGLIVTFAGLTVAGLAGVLGVWMERDPEMPPRWAWVFSFLILLALGVEMGHSVVQAREDSKTEEQMARVLEKLTIISARGDNPALAQFVNSELATQARANPKLVKRLEKKIAAKGGDAKSIRKLAAAGKRKAAGLPAKKGGKGAAMGGKAGKTGGKNGKKGGKNGAKDDADDATKKGGKDKAGAKSTATEASDAAKTATSGATDMANKLTGGSSGNKKSDGKKSDGKKTDGKDKDQDKKKK